ncbi:aldo/keto reductase [Rhodoflexus caldus]|uniref:aldo/keto reductase n=1 Tax=Rhodoflexus caldus TaxID=2891236 RepID=UPI00202A5F25|nr:aldo/keto reductase [Rhodoflexus caldus]
MQYRIFGRTGWKVSEIGYGMWGMAGWTGSDDTESTASLDLSVELGCNFFDTAWAYGNGKSEQLLGELVRRHPDKKIYVASKIPAKNFKWPAKPEYRLEDCYPASHIVEYTERSLKNLGMERIDLMQFHVWDDGWADRDEWKEAVLKLQKEGKIDRMGISVNRWEPENCLKAIDTGLIDAIQVIYNIFDQAPEDKLFPVALEKNIAIIARVPFDEGSLTGTFTMETTFPPGDWRSTYFVPENLKNTVERVEKLKPLVPQGQTMAEMALEFILHHPAVSTIIPGMRKEKHVRQNIAVSTGRPMSQELLAALRHHRWDRTPTSWSQ